MIPIRSQVLGFGAMVPLVTAAGLAGVAPTLRTGLVPRVSVVWAGTVLAFLGGVRRGVSFYTPLPACSRLQPRCQECRQDGNHRDMEDNDENAAEKGDKGPVGHAAR